MTITATRGTTFATEGTRARGATATAATAATATRRRGAASTTSNDVEASYDNEEDVDAVANQLAVTSISHYPRTPPRNVNRGAPGFKKQAAEYIQVAMANGCFPLAMGSHQVKNPMSIELIEREQKLDDDGHKLLRCLQIKIWLKSVCDYDHIKVVINHDLHRKLGMPRSESGRGACILTITASKATAASTKYTPQYSGLVYIE